MTDIDPSASVCPFSEAICPDCDGEGEFEDRSPIDENLVIAAELLELSQAARTILESGELF